MLNFDYIWQQKPSQKHEEQGVIVGETTHADSVDMILLFNRWCNIMSKLIKLEEKYSNKYTQRIKILEKYRMCTYEEFEYLHIAEIEEKQRPLFHVFKSLGMYDNIERSMAVMKFERNKDGYLKFLAKNSPKNLMDWIHKTFSKREQVFPLEMMEAHTYMVAPTKSGKSTLMRHIIYELQEKHPKFTQIILDPHGELSQDLLKTKGHDVVYLDIDLQEGYIFSFNLFDVPNLEERTLRFAVENIIGVFNEIIVTNFSDNQRSVLKNTIDFLIDRGNSTMQDFLNLLNLEPTILEEAKEYDDYFKDNYLKGIINRTRESIYTKLDGILTRGLKDILIGESTVRLQELVNSGKTIIFNLDGLPDDVSKPMFGKILLTYVKNILLLRGASKNPLPLFLYIDECQVFVTKKYSELLSQMRKFGVRLVLANQYFQQLLDENTKHAIEQNTAIKIVRTNKVDDAKVIARVPEKVLLGEKKVNQYEFICDIWFREPTVFKSPDFLLTSKDYEYSETELENLKQKQIENFYKKIGTNKRRTNLNDSPPTTDSKDSKTEDQPPFDIYLGEDAPDTK